MLIPSLIGEKHLSLALYAYHMDTHASTGVSLTTCFDFWQATTLTRLHMHRHGSPPQIEHFVEEVSLELHCNPQGIEDP